MFKKHNLLTVLSSLLLVFAASGGIAQAHVLKENNGISAVLHIPPDDSPEAAEPTELQIDFGDPKDAFNLPDCVCGVQVTSQGRVIQQVGVHPALAGATLAADTDVRFPKIGIYNVIVYGHAKDGAFPDFRMVYLERIATAANTNTSSSKSSDLVDILTLSGAGVIIIVMVVSSSMRRRKAKP